MIDEKKKTATELIPVKIVEELDHYIVGQKQAKRAVAIALRNRWRRQNVRSELKEEIYPKNILMIGPTGVGKTEIARRLAKLSSAPFLKVEATKYTEVGYVGKDVESIIRDLVEIGITLIKSAEQKAVLPKAKDNAEEQLLDLLVPIQGSSIDSSTTHSTTTTTSSSSSSSSVENIGAQSPLDRAVPPQNPSSTVTTREKFRIMLRAGELEDREVEIESKERLHAGIEVFAIPGMEDMDLNLRDMLQNMLPKKSKRRKMKVSEARKFLENEEAQRLVDMDRVIPQALARVQENGIIFLDEMDKIAEPGGSHRGGPNVSREGVQRDLLPIVEGTSVNTKYGVVKTDHILFIGAGAFHKAKPSDLIAELQGRFPIRVELQSLTTADFISILTEPTNSLLKQYSALLETEKVNLVFSQDAIESIAKLATELNEKIENIGARRLHTILEKILEEVNFSAPNLSGQTVEVTAKYIQERLGDLIQDQDMSRYIL